MCVIEQKTYVTPDGRSQTYESTKPCSRSVGGRLCNNVAQRVYEPILVADERPVTNNDNADNGRVILEDKEGHRTVYRPLSGTSSKSSGQRSTNMSSPVSHPSSASSPLSVGLEEEMGGCFSMPVEERKRHPYTHRRRSSATERPKLHYTRSSPVAERTRAPYPSPSTPEAPQAPTTPIAERPSRTQPPPPLFPQDPVTSPPHPFEPIRRSVTRPYEYPPPLEPLMTSQSERPRLDGHRRTVSGSSTKAQLSQPIQPSSSRRQSERTEAPAKVSSSKRADRPPGSTSRKESIRRTESKRESKRPDQDQRQESNRPQQDERRQSIRLEQDNRRVSFQDGPRDNARDTFRETYHVTEREPALHSRRKSIDDHVRERDYDRQPPRSALRDTGREATREALGQYDRGFSRFRDVSADRGYSRYRDSSVERHQQDALNTLSGNQEPQNDSIAFELAQMAHEREERVRREASIASAGNDRLARDSDALRNSREPWYSTEIRTPTEARERPFSGYNNTSPLSRSPRDSYRRDSYRRFSRTSPAPIIHNPPPATPRHDGTLYERGQDVQRSQWDQPTRNASQSLNNALNEERLNARMSGARLDDLEDDDEDVDDYPWSKEDAYVDSRRDSRRSRHQ